MANVQKSSRGAIGHMLSHYDRLKDKNGEYIKFNNQDIDTSKTYLNYEITSRTHQNKLDFIHKRLSEIKYLNRKDVIVMANWVITAPQDLKSEDTEKFFKATYEFLKARYGDKNVIGASVHMDEKSPHMHFHFMPITNVLKKGSETEYEERLNAKKVICRKELSTFHKDLQKFIDKSLNYHVSICSEVTKELGNMTIDELKKQQYILEKSIAKTEPIKTEKTLFHKNKELVDSSDLVELNKMYSLNNTYKSLIGSLNVQNVILEIKTKELTDKNKQADELRGEFIKSIDKARKYNEIAPKLQKQAEIEEQYKTAISNLKAENEQIKGDNLSLIELNNALKADLADLKAKNKDYSKMYNQVAKEAEIFKKKTKDYENFIRENQITDKSRTH